MANEVIGKCPVCGDALVVSELHCHGCGTRISGGFELCRFCKLPPDQRSFAEVFIKNRGNIREVERELGISYPTVRSRLETLIRALGYPVSQDSGRERDETMATEARKKILNRLEDGEITPQEAAKLLRTVTAR